MLSKLDRIIVATVSTSSEAAACVRYSMNAMPSVGSTPLIMFLGLSVGGVLAATYALYAYWKHIRDYPVYVSYNNF